MSQPVGSTQPTSTTMQPISAEVLKNRLTFIGMLLLIVGLLLEGIRSVLFISFRATVFSVMVLLAGLLLLATAGVLFIRMKYLLSLGKLDLNIFFDDPMLKIVSYLAPLYMLFKGIGFLGGDIIVGIGLTIAGILLLMLVILYQLYRFRGIPPTMMLLFSIFIIIIGVFLSVAGFINAGSSAPNVFLAHSGILGIAVMIIGIGLIIVGFTGQKGTTVIRVLLSLGYLLASIALITGGGLGIRDGINILRAGRAAALFRAMGALLLVAEVLGLIAGIMFIIIVLVTLGKELSKAAAAPPPTPPAPQAPPPPPP